MWAGWKIVLVRVDTLLDEICGILVDLCVTNRPTIHIDEHSLLVKGRISMKAFGITSGDSANSVTVIVVDQAVDLTS